MGLQTKLSKTFIILIPGFPVDETDTTCLPAQQLLVKEINKLYPSIEIIVLTFQYPFHNKEYSWYGNRVIPFNGRNKNGISRLITWIKVYRQLSKLKKTKKYHWCLFMLVYRMCSSWEIFYKSKTSSALYMDLRAGCTCKQ